MLNPILLYSNKTAIGNFTVYHNKPLDKKFTDLLEQAKALTRKSEFYHANLQIDVCLKDGSVYPNLIKGVLGPDFLTSFANKIIFTGDLNDYENNFIKIGTGKVNMTQMLAHGLIHCLQFNKHGLWHANPIAGYPNWKWEGYPEYISRNKDDQTDLKFSVQRYLAQSGLPNQEWLNFADSTGTFLLFEEYRLLVKFCIEQKKMSYDALLKDPSTQEEIKKALINWYQK